MKSTSDPTQNVTITKQDVIDMMQDLPDRFDAEELMYRLYVLLKIENAEASIREHGLIPEEEVDREIEEWLA